MVLNSMLLVRMAETSAEIWQHIACLPETISSHELIDLVLCFPLQQLGRFALCIWTFFCVPPPPLTHSSYLLYHSQSSNSASNSDSDADSDVDYQQRYYYHDSHSD